MNLLRLCRNDNLGVRDYDWGNTDLPYFDVRDVDAFEACDLHTGEYLDLSHTVEVALTKTRMLHDLRSLHRELYHHHCVGRDYPSIAPGNFG